MSRECFFICYYRNKFSFKSFFFNFKKGCFADKIIFLKFGYPAKSGFKRICCLINIISIKTKSHFKPK